jgi:hypothetical protein
VLCVCSPSTTKCSSSFSPQNKIFCRCNNMTGICSENSSFLDRMLRLISKNSGKNDVNSEWNCYAGGDRLN